MSRHSVTFSKNTDSPEVSASDDDGSEAGSSSCGESKPLRMDSTHPRRLNRSFSLVPERMGMGSLAGGALTKEERNLANCEIIIHAMAVALVLLFFPWSLMWCFKVRTCFIYFTVPINNHNYSC